MTGQWRGSNRRAELPPDWQARRKRVLARDGYRCQWPGCAATATDVDHMRPGNDHSEGNLRSLCGWHHQRKSSSEGGRAGKRYYKRRPDETHPGVIDDGTRKGRNRPGAQAHRGTATAQ